MIKNSLIVFDIDGTLTDSVQIHQTAFRNMLRQIGIKNLDADFGTFKHHTDSYILKKIYEHDGSSPISIEIMEAFETGLDSMIRSQEIYEIPGAKKLVDHICKKTNYAVCFATGSLSRPAHYKLQSIGLQYSDDLLVASDTIYERENIVLTAIEQSMKYYQVDSFEHIISIGDGVWDFQTAQNLNLEFIGIGKTENFWKDIGASIFFHDLESLYNNLPKVIQS